jgi:hypothetical protein
MKKARFGQLSPRYKFLLNPHEFQKLSRCPTCNKLTYPRKFPLVIAVTDAMPIVLGKTCKYCSRCELIICQQDELEARLAHMFQRINPAVIGNEYVVIGTVTTKLFKAGLEGNATAVGEMNRHVADFKKQLTLDMDPGGWRLPDADPARYVISHNEAVKRLVTAWTKRRERMI